MGDTWKVYFSAFILSLLIAVISYIVNDEIPLPYMDEIFHVPQVQQYCRYNFTHWDPMITTPPGLYLLSLVIVKPIGWLLGSNYCITSFLRAQNGLLSLATFFVLYKLHKSFHLSPVISSFTLSLFPFLFFFSFLYYTDVGSTITVLLGYLMSRHGHHFFASLVLGWSLLFRQTNIIWAGFVAADSILQYVEPQIFTSERKGYLSQFFFLIQTVLKQLPILLRWVWSYILLAICFGAFLYLNNGVVLGDRSHHTVSLHLPQLLYFSGFACFFSIGPLLSQWKYLLKSPFTFKFLVGFVTFSLFGLVAVHYYTMEHPYLLADNRHYTFYVWKNIFRRHEMVKYYLIPVYSVCWLTILSVIMENRSIWWTLLFFTTCSLVLIPQPLLEFRYYIIPYLIYRLSFKDTLPLWNILLELGLYGAINAITVWLFIARPFYWEGNSHDLQRFMW